MNIWYKIKLFIYNYLKGEFEPAIMVSKLDGWCFIVGRDRTVLYMSQSDSEAIQWAMDSMNGGIVKLKVGEYTMDKPINIAVDGITFDGEGTPVRTMRDLSYSVRYCYPPVAIENMEVKG